MYFSLNQSITLVLLAASSVHGHGVITGATGDQGGAGSALGVDQSTPRDGTRRNPFQQDTTKFGDEASDSCGETNAGGVNDIEAGTQAVMADNGGTLPQVSMGGQVMMTLHQVNADGAGPYTCEVDMTGQGTNFQPMEVTQNVDGNRRSVNRDGNKSDNPLTAVMPAGGNCTGTVAGQEGVCMVRCMNNARAGPFGGCVPVQMVQAAAAGTANNAAAGTANNAANGNANTANTANNANTGNTANTANTADTGNTGNTANTGNGAAGTANTANNANANTGAGTGGDGNANARRSPRGTVLERSFKVARRGIADRLKAAKEAFTPQEATDDADVEKEHNS